MTEAEFVEVLRTSVNELLRWVGFGTLTGLAAKAVMPGRDPGGAVATMLTGIGGSVIGCGTVLFFWRDATVDPISMKGFFAAVFGAFTLLFFYRLLAGCTNSAAARNAAKSWMTSFATLRECVRSCLASETRATMQGYSPGI
jgi:uncharacterized membrane protein YeaQ/YmgE (transglycosylase-associated protein family)